MKYHYEIRNAKTLLLEDGEHISEAGVLAAMMDNYEVFMLEHNEEDILYIKIEKVRE